MKTNNEVAVVEKDKNKEMRQKTMFLAGLVGLIIYIAIEYFQKGKIQDGTLQIVVVSTIIVGLVIFFTKLMRINKDKNEDKKKYLKSAVFFGFFALIVIVTEFSKKGGIQDGSGIKLVLRLVSFMLLGLILYFCKK